MFQKQRGPLTRPSGQLETSLLQPSFDNVSAMLGFPSFQHLVVAALGFDHFTCVRVFVNLNGALAASTLHRGHRSLASVRIEQRDHIAQGVVVLGEQGAEFVFKLNLFLKLLIVFEGFEAGGLLGNLGLEGLVFCDDRHADS